MASYVVKQNTAHVVTSGPLPHPTYHLNLHSDSEATLLVIQLLRGKEHLWEKTQGKENNKGKIC